MSEYRKLKVTAAKVGVTMAFLALLAGLAEAQVPTERIHLKLKGLSPELKGDFRMIGSLTSRLEEEEGIFYYFEHNTAKHFLTGTDANRKYLSIGATARNSSKLGGLSPSSLVHGDGGLVSGAATLSGGAKSQKLLSAPGIEVDVAINSNDLPSVTVDNSTGVSLQAVVDQGGADAVTSLSPGSNSLTLSPQSGVDQLHLETFPAGSFNRIVTLILSINSNPAQGTSSFAGQLIDGGI